MDTIKRGDIYYADLSPVVGSEQGGMRPVLIIQNDVGNKYSPTVIVAAITSRDEKAGLPTHIIINPEDSCLPKRSTVLLEQIRTIDKRRMKRCLGSLPAKQMQLIDQAILLSFGITMVYPKRVMNCA